MLIVAFNVDRCLCWTLTDLITLSYISSTAVKQHKAVISPNEPHHVVESRSVLSLSLCVSVSVSLSVSVSVSVSLSVSVSVSLSLSVSVSVSLSVCLSLSLSLPLAPSRLCLLCSSQVGTTPMKSSTMMKS